MTRLPFIRAGAFMLLCVAVSSLTTAPENQASRRAFLGRLPVAAAAVVTAGAFLQHHSAACLCANCCLVPPANAYERRDVGGADASAQTKAMNLQAFETNNRLERQGLKLETAAEQSASLTAALSEYSYSPSTSSKSGKKGSTDKKKTPSTN